MPQDLAAAVAFRNAGRWREALRALDAFDPKRADDGAESLRASILYREAQRLIGEGDRAGAEALLAATLARVPKKRADDYLRLLLAALNAARGADAAARRALEAGLAAAPCEEERISRVRAFAWLGRYAEAAVEGEAILSRGATLHEVRLLRYPWSPQRADACGGAHAALLEKALARRPEDPWLLLYHGFLARSPRSWARLRSVVGRRRARYGWMLQAAGSTFLRAGSYAQAIDYLGVAASPKNADWQARCFLGEALLCAGRQREAFASFAAAHEQAAAHERCEVLAWRGEMSLWLGRYERALEDLEPALAGGALWALTWRAGARLLLGKPKEALADLDEAQRRYTGDREAPAWRAQALRALGRPREALAAVAAEPAGPWSLLNRALARADLGESAALDADYERLPAALKDYAARRFPKASKKARLENVLKSARGCRAEQYAWPVWMV
jgi:hypothetical protein